MKNFKPLAIAAAVSTAAAGYAGVVNAQEVSAANTGSLAIVPYYTVQEGYITGINIVNTTESTQVVKVRFRRGSDSMDALDFNVIMSPEDIFNGYISGDDEDNIAFRTNDNTCTAPILPFEEGSDTTRIAPMPNQTNATGITFEEGAMEGYVEIIAMGQPDPAEHPAGPAPASTPGEGAPIAVGAKHDTGASAETIDNDGMPLNCTTVADNFFRNATNANQAGTPANRGVISSSQTHQRANNDDKPYVSAENDPSGDGSVVTPNFWIESDPNALSVSYFIRDTSSGLEFGGRAVHVEGFSQEAMMSNQSRIVEGIWDPWGFYFPDLDGGSPLDTDRGLYDGLVRPALGVEAIMNNWGTGSSSRNIDADWVVTLPGQYLMVDLRRFIADTQSDLTKDDCKVDVCDYRDIPVQMSIEYFDREEDKVTIIPDEDELVLSPASATPPDEEFLLLRNEVNVIRWHGYTGTDDGALDSEYGSDFPISGSASNGWARLSVTADVQDPSVPNPDTPSVCEISDESPETCTEVANELVPIVGFAAWKRNLDNADRNYGRIIDHSWQVSSDQPR